METGILIALISAGSMLLGGVFTHLFKRKQTQAETDRIAADCEKTEAEAELTQSTAWKEYATMLRDEMKSLKDEIKTMKETQEKQQQEIDALKDENKYLSDLLTDFVKGAKKLEAQLVDLNVVPDWAPRKIEIKLGKWKDKT